MKEFRHPVRAMKAGGAFKEEQVEQGLLKKECARALRKGKEWSQGRTVGEMPAEERVRTIDGARRKLYLISISISISTNASCCAP
jgi:hypothetical protein